ncbi:MAG: flagellar biosynthetic protein FliR [Holosporales bacterium]|jgi:flagellar biosynthetic protein FliR|nr:flagellar biosynthetic protein FliR [Holosporales bacterium]
MHHYTLLSSTVSLFFLIFARVGTALSVSSGFGELFISPRIRLALAASLSFCLYFPLETSLSAATHSALISTFFGEMLIGFFAGLLARTAVLTLKTAGSVMSMFSGLHLGSFFSPLSSTEESAYSTFLTMTALTILFLGDMHHWILKGIVDSYTIYTPGQMDFPIFGFANFANWINRCFGMSLRLAAPFLVTQLLFFLGVGLVNRLVMQMQVYFLTQPIQILAGVLTLYLSLPFLLQAFFAFFEESIFTKFIVYPTG